MIEVDNLKNSILVSHPMQQHSFKLASALEDAGMLHSYYTTVYYQENKKIYKILSKLLSESNIKRMKGRKLDKIDKKIATINELEGILFTLIVRIDKSNFILPKYMHIFRKRFGNKVAKYAIKNNVKAVVVYDTWGKYCVEYLKENSNIITIMDMSSISAQKIVEVVNIDKKNKSKLISKSYENMMKLYKDKYINEFNQEIDLCDYVITPSNFSKKSILERGKADKNIYLCPYGVDINRFSCKTNYNIINRKIRFLFVGRLSAAKGIFYLLEAFKQLNNEDIELVCVGSMMGLEREFEPYSKYFKYMGTKLNEEMMHIYKECDVYIMPSLWEGMSLTIGEAMACGLPIIATNSTGGENVIEEGVNGFIIDSMDVEQLKNRILWFVENKDKIEYMGKKSHERILKQTWNVYSENVVNIMQDILLNHKKI